MKYYRNVHSFKDLIYRQLDDGTFQIWNSRIWDDAHYYEELKEVSLNELAVYVLLGEIHLGRDIPKDLIDGN